jgi:ketosteroid isomerase-like protein
MADPDVRRRVREALEGIGEEGDFGEMSDAVPPLMELFSNFASPDFKCVMTGLPPAPRTEFPGVEGIARAWRDYGAAFESVRAEVEGVREAEDHIVLLVKQRAVTRRHGVPIAQPSALVVVFDEDLVARIEFHLDRAEALRVAGLQV